MQSSAAVCRRLRLLLPDSLKFKLLNASHDSSFAAAAASASCCCSGFLLLLLCQAAAAAALGLAA
jgi:hypothetical protein